MEIAESRFNPSNDYIPRTGPELFGFPKVFIQYSRA
jgi:hypothetical protein